MSMFLHHNNNYRHANYSTFVSNMRSSDEPRHLQTSSPPMPPISPGAACLTPLLTTPSNSNALGITHAPSNDKLMTAPNEVKQISNPRMQSCSHNVPLARKCQRTGPDKCLVHLTILGFLTELCFSWLLLGIFWPAEQSGPIYVYSISLLIEVMISMFIGLIWFLCYEPNLPVHPHDPSFPSRNHTDFRPHFTAVLLFITWSVIWYVKHEENMRNGHHNGLLLFAVAHLTFQLLFLGTLVTQRRMRRVYVVPVDQSNYYYYLPQDHDHAVAATATAATATAAANIV